MNDLLNCMMSLMLPFAVIPTIAFSSSKNIMGDFANGLTNKLVATTVSLLVVAVNIYFVLDFIASKHITNVLAIMFISILGFFYLVFCLYLAVDAMIHMGFTKLAEFRIIQQFYRVEHLQYQVQQDEDEQGPEPEG